MTYDYQGTFSVNSFVDEFSELRKRDARSLFSCQDLGSIFGASSRIVDGIGKFVDGADFMSLCESSCVGAY